jgi:hypothetical protein
MKSDLKQVSAAMWAVLGDPRASRIERIESAKVILSCHGQLVPDVNESFLSVRQLTQLRAFKQRTVEKVMRKKERRKRQNRKAYLRRQIKTLEAQQPNGELSNG